MILSIKFFEKNKKIKIEKIYPKAITHRLINYNGHNFSLKSNIPTIKQAKS